MEYSYWSQIITHFLGWSIVPSFGVDKLSPDPVHFSFPSFFLEQVLATLLIFPLSGDIGKPLLTGSDVLSLLVPSIDALSLLLVPSIEVMLVSDSVSLTLFELGLSSSLSSTWDVPTETPVSNL